MNITNILVDRATRHLVCSLWRRQRLPHTHAHRAESDRRREGVKPTAL